MQTLPLGTLLVFNTCFLYSDCLPLCSTLFPSIDLGRKEGALGSWEWRQVMKGREEKTGTGEGTNSRKVYKQPISVWNQASHYWFKKCKNFKYIFFLIRYTKTKSLGQYLVLVGLWENEHSHLLLFFFLYFVILSIFGCAESSLLC